MFLHTQPHTPEWTKVTQPHRTIGHMFYPLRQMSSHSLRETAKLMALGHGPVKGR